ncbi:hypothetical protein [Synechocystis sp. PCC 7338]|uniref:hypothetical protein n=1 Tax=Synechocystis sp. PCC 7338 TaxID=2732530 RepID=UPI001BAF7A37|nr:hypothetical protein [Synechocystis sp. PCC 7338]QUS62549.1 hypothetical protein HTZ78_17650 [Synechocystis sp. PCC 7338]
MARFITTSKQRACPVCAKTNGNCRIAEDKVLCMTFADAVGDNPDYGYAKPSRDGLWGIHVPQKDRDRNFDRAEWERRRSEREERQLEIEQQRRQKCLSSDQRHAEITVILEQLSLSSQHHQYLQQRGVPEQIIERCRSVQQWQKLRHPAHINLPGVWKDGRGLTNGWDGILIPVTDHLGRYIALRLHNPHASTNGKPKYCWLTSSKRGIGPQLSHGELPVALHGPEVTTKQGFIGLCEGMEFKGALAAHRLGHPVIGFSGHHAMAQSPEQIQSIINHCAQQWAMEPEAITLVVIPDDNCLSNNAVARSLIHTLDYWQGRGQPMVVAWWGQQPGVGDIDEIPDRLAVEQISPRLFRHKCPIPSGLGKFQDWITAQVAKLKPQGFAALKPEGKIFTGDGQTMASARQSAWQSALHRGNAVLDASAMGEGKSHGVANFHNPWGGKVWYVSRGHRNPTIEAISHQYVDLPPRSQYGFYRDHQGKLQLAKADTPETLIVEKGNCIRADLFPMLSNLGYQPNGSNDGLNPICASCPMANVCAHSSGWYRADRRKILSHASHIRCDIESMPRDWDYSHDIIILEEATQALSPTKTITASWSQLLNDAHRCRQWLSGEQWTVLDHLLVTIEPLFEQAPYHGWLHGDILDQLPGQPLGVLEVIRQNIIQQSTDLTPLFPIAEPETLSDNLTPGERKKWGAGLKAFNAHQHRTAHRQSQQNLQNLPPNAIVHLLTAITGGSGVGLQLRRQQLYLTIDRRPDYAFLNDAKGLILLDATTNSERQRTFTGIEREIEVIRSDAPPLTNLKVRQINMAGIASRDISHDAVNRIQGALQILGDQPTIGIKGWGKWFDWDGHWFNHNRGSNAFVGQTQMTFVGLPSPNIGAVQAELIALHGNADHWQEEFHRRQNEEILQGIGRPRANRFPDQSFLINMIVPHGTDLSWLSAYGITVEINDAMALDPALGDTQQVARFHLLQAIRQVMDLGIKPTQAAIAQRLNISQQAISKLLKNAKVKLAKLITAMVAAVSRQNTTPPIKGHNRSGCENSQQLLQDYAWFLNLDPGSLAAEVIQVAMADNWDGALSMLEHLPKPLLVRTLGVIYALICPQPPPDVGLETS